MAQTRILIAEDETHLRDILRFQLEKHGYAVIEACDGAQAVELGTRELPDLILLDVMMPNMDGFEACRRLRETMATRQIPIIMLTAKTEDEAKLLGFEGGANDYVTKPYNAAELMLRVRNTLRWGSQQRAASPLTGLPGNVSIDEELRRRIASREHFALLQIDVDHFKSFNDYYGYARGDEAIRRIASILTDAAGRHGGPRAFVGHIGGDDFIVVCPPEHAEALGEMIIERFNQAIETLYDPVDRGRGHLEVRNRQHQLERFPLMSLTIALVSTDLMPITHLAQLTDIAQELKAHGKGIPGSVLVGERRRRSAAREAPPGTTSPTEAEAA